jgi:L-alanine-DL-glutamate epimerase-like enolase superfamily enzyme
VRIVELAAFQVRIPLKRQVRHASHARTDTESLIVRATLDTGHVGWGEGLPRKYVTGESIDDAWSLFQQADLARRLAGAFDDLRGCLALLDGFDFDRPAGVRDCFGNSARCAVEIAILDAVCRRASQPLSAVTSAVGEAAGIRESCERVQYSVVLTPTKRWKETCRNGIYRAFGFRHAKLKVGVEGVDDTALVERTRRQLGTKFDLRLDANEAWPCASIAARVEPLTRFGISSLEQPCPHAEVDQLAALRGKVPVPIMLDESLCSLGDGRRAIERGLCDLFNLRLSKCGGFVNSLKLAALAHRAGLGYQLGCQVGETGILSAAGRHFATSVAGIRYVEGSFDRFLVKERLTVEDITFGRGGWAPALAGPGLGVTVDPEAVRRVTEREFHVNFS